MRRSCPPSLRRALMLRSISLAGLDGIERLIQRANELVNEGKDLTEVFGKDLKV